MMIDCISSLLDTFEEYSRRPEGYDERQGWYIPKEYERGWLLDDQDRRYLLHTDKIPKLMATDSKIQGYKGLVVQGLSILLGLAVNEDNCRVIISNTQGLLSKAIAPLLVLDQLHSGDDQHDDEWCSMAEESLELMRRLMATPPGETETKLRNEMSGNTQAIIRAVKGILECLRCQVLLKRQAIEVLLDLSVDTHTPVSIMLLPGGSGSSSTMFVWILLHIFLVPDYHFNRMCGSAHSVNKSSDIKRLAGEELHAMLSSQTSTLQSVGDVIGSLARTVAGAENNAYRIHAATILEHLCRHYTKNDENLKDLKKAMASVMEEVIIKLCTNIFFKKNPFHFLYYWHHIFIEYCSSHSEV
jgi:hypothetical protein